MTDWAACVPWWGARVPVVAMWEGGGTSLTSSAWATWQKLRLKLGRDLITARGPLLMREALLLRQAQPHLQRLQDLPLRN